jgi:hypothetical protein
MTSVFENGTVNGYEVIDGVAYGPDGSESQRPIPASPPSSRTIVGSNAYLEWGYWSSYAYFYPNPSSTGTTYYVGNFIRTPDSQIAALAAAGIVGTYTGTAIGAHYASGYGVVQMTGTFNTTINFATAAVTNFNISVSGGSRSAYISGASGQIGYNGEPGMFRVSGGSVGVSDYIGVPVAVSTWNASGVVVGPNGEAVAVDWWLHGVSNRAGGVAQGTR